MDQWGAVIYDHRGKILTISVKVQKIKLQTKFEKP